MKQLLTRCLTATFAWGLAAHALAGTGVSAARTSSVTSRSAAELDAWIDTERRVALTGLMANISPNGTARGVVVASPSRQNPNYFFHWVRDAALVMDHVVDRYARATDGTTRDAYWRMIWEYIDFSRGNQTTPNRSGGLGEPKFNVDGSAFADDWGRPQNDGPALRALTLTKFAELLMANGYTQAVRDRLYDGRIPTDAVIKADLEYISHHWQEKNFDVWEEVYGDHFYNRLVQRNALVRGAALADRLGDNGAADWYRRQASAISADIVKYWRGDAGFIEVTRDRAGGIDYKNSGLDSVVVLAALHADIGDGFFDAADDRILATAQKIEASFAHLYPVNGNHDVGVGIGRYPEDRYDGYRTDREGNPWFLTTLGFAELHYRLYDKLKARGEMKVTDVNAKFLRSLFPADASAPSFLSAGHVVARAKDRASFESLLAAIKAKGDNFVRRVRQHADDSGRMAEQFSRHNGYMQGASDLTWSYAAFLTAAQARP